MARGDNMNRNPSPAGIKIPLNDDDAEKAKRMKKRSMLQEVQIRRQSFKQVGTPRKGLDGESSVEGTPKTPRNVGSLRESLNPITPLRRAPLVVNFEEWMRMANDNVCFLYLNSYTAGVPSSLTKMYLGGIENQCPK